MVNGHWARFALASSVSLLKPKHQYCFTMSGEKGGVFSRRSDKRFVKQVRSSDYSTCYNKYFSQPCPLYFFLSKDKSLG